MQQLYRTESAVYQPSRDISHWHREAFPAVSPRFEALAAEGVNMMGDATGHLRPTLRHAPLLAHDNAGRRIVNPTLTDRVGSSESTWGTVFKHGAACLALARGASAISAHPDSRPHARGDGAQFFIPPALREKVNVQLRQGDAPLLVLPGPPSLIGLGWKRGQDPSGVVMTLPQVEVAVWQYGEFPDRPSVLVHAGAGQDPNSSRADQRRFVAELQDTVPTTRTAIAPETIEQLGSAMVFAASELPPAQTTYYATGY